MYDCLPSRLTHPFTSGDARIPRVLSNAAIGCEYQRLCALVEMPGYHECCRTQRLGANTKGCARLMVFYGSARAWEATRPTNRIGVTVDLFGERRPARVYNGVRLMVAADDERSITPAWSPVSPKDSSCVGVREGLTPWARLTLLPLAARSTGLSLARFWPIADPTSQRYLGMRILHINSSPAPWNCTPPGGATRLYAKTRNTDRILIVVGASFSTKSRTSLLIIRAQRIEINDQRIKDQIDQTL